ALYNEKYQKVMAALKAKAGAAAKIQTQYLNLNPDYQVNNAASQVVGYTAINLISVETAKLELAGSLIDVAIAAGASQVTSIAFGLRDDSKARAEAVAAACRDAQMRAQSAAQALDLKIRRVTKILMGTGYRPAYEMNAGATGVGLANDYTTTTPIKAAPIV